MDLALIFGAVGLLFVILVALGGVVAFAWKLYILIQKEITTSAAGIHERLDDLLKVITDVDKRLAVLEALEEKKEK